MGNNIKENKTFAEMRELVEQRKKEAKDKNIVEKAIEIAKLGISRQKNHGAWHIYKGKKLTVEWDDYGGNLSVTWHNLRVLNVHLGEIVAYRPDIPDWEEHLEELYYGQAVPVIRVEQLARGKSELEGLHERWGIAAPVEVLQ